MLDPFKKQQLLALPLSPHIIFDIQEDLNQLKNQVISPIEAWVRISKIHLRQETNPNIFLFFFNWLFPNWETHPGLYPATIPTDIDLKTANISKLMQYANVNTISALHSWCRQNYSSFLDFFKKTLSIQFKKPPLLNCNYTHGIKYPDWFFGAHMNIVDSCFNAPKDKTALVYLDSQQNLVTYSYGELNNLANRVASSLVKLNFKAGDVIGIIMPLNLFAIGIYLGIIKMGGIVVSIPDSFSSEEIANRLKIANAKIIFVEDEFEWDNKQIFLYEKIITTVSIPIIVHSCNQIILKRSIDYILSDFLLTDTTFESITSSPMSPCQILFSSGTTGTPKAIIWEQATAIKAASDAYLYQDIKGTDVMLWPTNLGWMMGPWTIFAVLINQATLALYTDTPKSRKFGEFIVISKVSVLGVVPTLVNYWRQTECMRELNWHHIRLFTSTGECSNANDMFYLMALGGMKPVIEYCGGTEIGGAYLSSTLIEKNYPTVFTTPVMGTTLYILDETGHESEIGEVAIEPPALGLSRQLLNEDHEQVYYAGMPKKNHHVLRRHGDLIQHLKSGGYILLGRVDDTMNLNGIKVSSAEIERAIKDNNIIESAAIAISKNGPNLLVIYVVTHALDEKKLLQQKLQTALNKNLNPLFKIHDIVLVNELPKTPSNKIMRRLLRRQYEEKL